MLARLACAAMIGATAMVGACDEADATSVKITLAADLSGTIVTSSVVSQSAGPAEGAISGGGVAWDSRGGVVVSRGTFKDVKGLTLGEVTFAMGDFAGKGAGKTMKVILPRGPGVKWPAMLAPMDEKARMGTASALDQAAVDEKRASTIGQSVKITIRTPGKPTGSMVNVSARGVDASSDRKEVTLVVPLRVVMEAGPALEWVVGWE